MAVKDELTEQIRYYTEMLRLLWLTTVAVGGGTVGLVLNPADGRRALWAAVGIVTMIALILAIEYCRRRIRQTVRQLREV